MLLPVQLELLREFPPEYDRVILLIKQSNTGSRRLPTIYPILTGLLDRLINFARTSIVPQRKRMPNPCAAERPGESLSNIFS